MLRPTPIRRPPRLLAVTGALLAICGVILLSLATRAVPHLRDRVVDALNGRFRSQVSLESLQVSVFPRPEVSGTGLVLRHDGRTDVPPLIQLDRFAGGAGIAGLFASPLSLRTVDLEGLVIRIPPGGLRTGASGRERSGGRLPSLSIDRIAARRARLELASRDPGRLPRVFDIHDLTIAGFRPDAPAAFTARLTNPVPRGEILTEGRFGPWVAHEPAQTHLAGRYEFRDANLDTIKGIGGMLSSTGTYEGALERIAVQGTTASPDFRLDIAGRPMQLRTRFDAIVDGTNGDTFLDRIEATLGETSIRARGKVVRAVDVKGRHVALAVEIDQGRLEDVLQLAVDADRPPLTGLVSVESAVLVPAGDERVLERLRLDGRFALARARFTDYDVQTKVLRLSRRARGDTRPASGGSLVSNMSGRFVLRAGVLRLTGFRFAVPGAVVRLDGTYALRSGAMDFTGDLLMDASLADMTTGFKSILARLAQPLFRGPRGGTKLPIKVAGTRDKPEFGLDVRRALTPGD